MQFVNTRKCQIISVIMVVVAVSVYLFALPGVASANNATGYIACCAVFCGGYDTTDFSCITNAYYVEGGTSYCGCAMGGECEQYRGSDSCFE